MRDAPNGFDAESGIDERIPNSGEYGSDRGPYFSGSPPDQYETSCFDKYGDERDSRAAQPVRQMAEQHACENQRHREGAERQPDRTPAAVRKEERTEGEDRAKADAAESRPNSW